MNVTLFLRVVAVEPHVSQLCRNLAHCPVEEHVDEIQVLDAISVLTNPLVENVKLFLPLFGLLIHKTVGNVH